MTVKQTADDFMRRLDNLKTPDNASQIDSIKKDLHDKIFSVPYDFTYIDKCCEAKDVYTLREELVFSDLFLRSAQSLIQDVYAKAVQKGQIAISDRIEQVVEHEPWGWPISKIDVDSWMKLSLSERNDLCKEVNCG